MKPLTPDSKVTLLFACNTPWDGAFLGYLTGFDCGEIDMRCPQTDFSPRLVFEQNHFLVEGEKFLLIKRQRHQPELSSDEVITTAGEVCRLLNFSRANEFFQPASAPIPIWRAWRSGEAFTSQHLQSCFDGGAR